MPFASPFELGPFAVDPEGRLTPRDPEARPSFNVQWRGRNVRAYVHPDADQGKLILHAHLGRVPSTAGSPGTTVRQLSFALVRGLAGAAPRGWRIGLRPDHQLLLRATSAIPLPITAVALVTEITAFLLALSPYLDLLDETGIRGSVPEVSPVAA